MNKKRSIFNKKKWLRNHLEEILRLKKQGSTHQAVIQHLTEQQNMPFELSESLLSRYLKEFAEDESTYKKVNNNLHHRIEQKNNRLTEKSHEIQNLKRRLDRILERNLHFEVENECLKDRNQLLENKFLEGEARLKDLSRYNSYNNVHWKIADLEEKNDAFFQTILSLERRCESLAKPHEEANEKIESLQAENQKIKHAFDLIQSELEESKQKGHSLAQDQQKIQLLKAQISELNSEKQALCVQLSKAEAPIIHLNQNEIAELTNKKQELIQICNAMKQHIKRLERDLSQNDVGLRQTVYQLNESEKNAKQYRFIGYGFMFICLVLFVFLFI